MGWRFATPTKSHMTREKLSKSLPCSCVLARNYLDQLEIILTPLKQAIFL